MLKESYIRFRITIYSPQVALERLRKQKIPIRNFKKIEEYTYEFSCSPIYLRRIKEIFEEATIIKKYGPLSIIQNLWLKKTTIIALAIASIFFYDITSRVYLISVTGINRNINAQMLNELSNMGVKKLIKKPSYQKLLDYEIKLRSVFNHDVEFIEVRLKGSKLVVNYTPRRSEINIPEKKDALYAKKDGLIAYFIVSTGEKMVKENQFVRAGDLLINDRILTPKGEEIIIGAYGQVYAYTWTIIDLSIDTNNGESADIFTKLLNEAKRMMSSGFYLDEKILEEHILAYNYETQKTTLKVHFTCLEDIAN